MVIAADIALSLFLVALGYAAACYYLKGIKWNKLNIEALKLNSRNKIIYIAAALISLGALIAVFQQLYGLSLIQQLKLLTLAAVLFPVAAVDYRVQKIPNQFVLAAVAFRCVFYIFEFILSPSDAFEILKDNLIGALVIGAFFLLLLLVFKNSIGMGDVKLFAVMGLYQGLWGAIYSIFFSLLVSFVLSLLLLITKKKQRKDTISFGPSILLGTILSIAMFGM